MLRVLGSVLGKERTAELDAELSWYQNLLGGVRDMQVQRERLAERLAALPSQDVLGPAAGYVDQSLSSEQAKRRAELSQALESDRYRALLDRVLAWTADPPVSVGLDKRQLRRLARKAARNARKRLAAALEVDDPALLHRARKAAKRARYATELAAPLAGKNSKRRIKRFKRAQDVLGEHQDSVVATQLLRRLGTGPEVTGGGKNGFTLGLLYAIEQAATCQARADAARLKP
jgi:CHAD domain-containing protein